MAFDYTNYYRLDYIETTGSQYLLTGFTPTANAEFKIGFTPTAYVNGSVFGTSWSGNAILVHTGASGSTIALNLYFGNGTVAVIYVSLDEQLDIYLRKGTASVNGVDYVVGTNPSALGNVSMGMNSSGSTYYYSRGRYTYFQIYSDSSTLVRDYVPARRKSDNVCGMYDVLNNTFTTSSTSTAFVGGWLVNATAYPLNSGTINGTGQYADGSTAILTATANGGYEFDYWTLNGYTRLDYIQSSGTQYIDTGLTIGANSREECDCIIYDTTGEKRQGCWNAGQSWGCKNGYMCAFGDSPTTAPVGNRYTVEVSYTSNSNANYTSFIVVDWASRTFSRTTTTTQKYFLFASSSNSGTLASGTQLSMRMYEQKFWDSDRDGNLVRHFIPVKRNSDNEIGLLDLVELKFYTNQGTGSFTGGAELGDVVFADNPLSVNVSGDISLTANFHLSYDINLVYDSTLGSASFYYNGSSIVLEATPTSIGQFIGWYINSNPLSVLNPYTYTPTGDVTIEARFGRVYTITDSVSGQGYIQYTRGQDQNDVTFSVIASPNWHFVKYVVNGTEYTTNPLSIHLTQNITITAVFEEDERYHISVSSDFPYGSFYLSDNDVYDGTTVTIWARPFPDYNFVRWQDGETSNPRQITVTSDVTLVAEYQRVSDTNGIYQYRCFIKDQLDLTAYPKAFLRVDTFDIRTDLLTNATSSITTMEMLSDVDEGDVLVLYDPKGTTLYTGVINSIEDRTIDCSQMQSFYKGTWIYNTAPSSYLEEEIASLLQDYADGKMRGSTYIDSLVAQRLGGITIDYTGTTAVNLPSTYEENSDSDEYETIDFEEFIYNLYQKYGIVFDFEINIAGANYVHIKTPNFTKIKVGNNMFAISDMTPITEVEETNRLIIYGSDKTYRTTYVATKNGIVEQPSTTANRFNITNTEIVFSDDPVADLVAANLPQTMYNHKLEFTLLIKNFIYEFGDFNLGGELDIYYGDEYYNSVLTGYEMQKDSNKNVTDVHFICGVVRTKLTQLLSLGKI